MNRLLLVLAACSSPEPSPSATAPARHTQRRAVVRIDAEVGGKGFQGVWLELPSGTRWVMAYRPHEIWRPFQDQEVVVTGHCYQPDGQEQAIGGQHFSVETMRFFKPRPGVFVDIGAEVRLRGTFADDHFIADGRKYPIAGMGRPEDRTKPGTVTIAARPVGPKIWVHAILENDSADALPVASACPE